MPAIPNFIIIGTMKGGTTTLYDFICLNNAVAKAHQKEIHYFSLYPNKSSDWYLSHFSPLGGQITGEASPTYFDMADSVAIPNLIKAFNPEIKLILMTRDPVERAVSHFYHLKNINKIDCLQNMGINEFFANPFENAIKQTSEIDYYLYQILYFSSYYRKLMYFNSVFKESLLVIDNKQLRNYSQMVMDKVFFHLGLKTMCTDEFTKVIYTSNRDSSDLDSEIKSKLCSFLYPDYEKFCLMSGISFIDSVSGS